MGKRDPTRTQTIRLQYSRQLVQLFNRFQVENTPNIRDILGHESNPYQSIELLVDSNLFNHVEKPAPEIIRKNIRLSYRRGLRMAEGQIQRLQPEFTLLDEESLRILEMNNLVLVKGVSADVKKNMMLKLTEGLSNGWGIEKIVRHMNHPVETVGKNRARVIARTEIIRACNTAASNRYKGYGVEIWEWLTSFDDRTCDTCAGLDGKRFHWGDHDVPPVHPQCRCSIVPVIE